MLKSKGVGHFGAKFAEKGVDRCKPNFLGETWGCRVREKSCRYHPPFEHNKRTWQTDRQTYRVTDTLRNGNIDRNRQNRLSAMSPKRYRNEYVVDHVITIINVRRHTSMLTSLLSAAIVCLQAVLSRHSFLNFIIYCKSSFTLIVKTVSYFPPLMATKRLRMVEKSGRSVGFSSQQSRIS